jgi:hypothetical protein
VRRFPLLLFAGSVSLAAQSFVEPARLDTARKALDPAAPTIHLRCDIKPIAAALNFSLRYQAGYSIDFPLSQYAGPGHGWTVLSKVVPEGGEARYLVLTAALPTVPEGSKLDGEIAGTFVVGEGTYSVETLLEDEQHRTCSGRWRIQVKRSGAERDLKLAVPPRTVESLWPGDAPAVKAPAGIERQSAPITVLLHAAPLSPRLSKLQPADVTQLAGSLAALLEQLRAPSIRLAIFNLNQRAMLYENDHFTASKLDEAIRALNETQLAVVNYQTLRDRRGPLEILDGIVRQQVGKSPAPGAIIFLGPYAPTFGKAPPEPAVHPASMAKLFYLEYRAAPRFFPGQSLDAGAGAMGRWADTPTLAPMPPTSPPDAVERFVKLSKGDSAIVRTPHEFAEAVGRILARLRDK